MFDEEQAAVEAEVAHQEQILEDPVVSTPNLPAVVDEPDYDEQVDPLDLPDHYDLPMHGSITCCPKCGGDKVRTDYHPHGVLSEPCGTRFGWPDIQNLSEHLCRTCTRCRYGWPEEVFSGA